MHKLFHVCLAALLLASCTSVKRTNRLLETPVSVRLLQKDINYVERKLRQKHPNYDLYISKTALAAKFDSLRQVVNHPMKPNDFYMVISPVVASVRQGHMSMLPLVPRFTRKEAKAMKEAGTGPISQFDYFWENDKLYVLNNHSVWKEIGRGAELLSVHGQRPQDIYTKYRPVFTSDGYNETFIRKLFARRFPVYLVSEIGVHDSLDYVFRQGDSVIHRMVHRWKEPAADSAGLKTSVTAAPQPAETDSAAAPAQMTKADIARKKEQDKKERERKWVYGYDKETKKYTRSLDYRGKDSSVAVLTIHRFMGGQFKKAYEAIFDTIQQRKCTTLILDIRDNPGGSAREIVKLFGYFADTDYVFYQPTEVVSKTSLLRSGLFQRLPKLAYPFAALFYPFYAGDRYFGTHKTGGRYYYKMYGSHMQEPKANRFSGKVYVLINGGCFSAACLLSSELRTLPGITFVGEETGGDFNGTVAGVMPQFRLPHTRLTWKVGLMHIRPMNQTKISGRGIFPDKEIIQTYEDRKNNKDPEMEWVMQQIESQTVLAP